MDNVFRNGTPHLEQVSVPSGRTYYYIGAKMIVFPGEYSYER